MKVGKLNEKYTIKDYIINEEISELNKTIEKLDRKKNKDKKDIIQNDIYPKGSKPHKAAVIADTIGDPLKDTSGPSLNILIKLSAIISLIFGSFFAEHSLFNL